MTDELKDKIVSEISAVSNGLSVLPYTQLIIMIISDIVHMIGSYYQPFRLKLYWAKQHREKEERR